MAVEGAAMRLGMGCGWCAGGEVCGMGSDRRRTLSVRLIGCLLGGVCVAALVGAVRVLAAAGRDWSAT